ncbi:MULTISPECIES: class I SAM-dependent methyltransferase [Pseudonocardia]|uniref:class I SAM-dependent methyltransferase n=1 Tax=Pseudonocardia TaxID=1847 RepID=UPI0010E78714|nr:MULTISPECIES: class I SAM-dependent methyltransferase [Pseudonocardia]TDN77354.1 methyltransferase family protein [Pseudonocardia autotrophica]
MSRSEQAPAPSYRGASAHYLSPSRRDPVKVLSEEPVTRRLIGEALAALGRTGAGPVSVLDIGAGTADGFALLTRAGPDAPPLVAPERLTYVGLDVDQEMVRTARATVTSPSASFVLGDVRDRLPDGVFDLYLSCGVPYSHLTREELVVALRSVLTAIAARGRRAAVVVDVLGRYSVEWQPRWDTERWDYAMSFFAGGGDAISEPMTFYSRPALDAVVDAARDGSGARIVTRSAVDRSVLVGRHTATGSFHPGVPRFRTLVNDLLRDPGRVRPADLRFTPATGGAPADVLAWLARFATRWNRALEPYPERAGALDDAAAARLAHALLELEREAGPGLGVGHSLTMTLVVEPA